MNRKGSTVAIIALIVVIILFLVGGIWYYESRRSASPLPQTAGSQSISAIRSSSNKLFYVSGGTLYVFDTVSQTTSTVAIDVEEVYWVDPYIIATNAADGNILVYNPSSKGLYSLPKSNALIPAQCFGPRGGSGGSLYPMSYSSSTGRLEVGCVPNGPLGGAPDHAMAVYAIGPQNGQLLFGTSSVGSDIENYPGHYPYFTDGWLDNVYRNAWSPDGTRLAILATTNRIEGMGDNPYYFHNLDVVDFSGTTDTVRTIVAPMTEDGCYMFRGWLDNTHVLCINAYSATSTFAVDINTLATSSARASVSPVSSTTTDQTLAVLSSHTTSMSDDWVAIATDTIASYNEFACGQSELFVLRLDGSRQIFLGPICGYNQFVWYPSNLGLDYLQ